MMRYNINHQIAMAKETVDLVTATIKNKSRDAL